MDKQLLAAVGRGDAPTTELDLAFQDWGASGLHARPAPPVEPVWFSDELCQVVRDWAYADQTRTGIVWVEDVALGERLRDAFGLCYFGEGINPPTDPNP